MNYDWVFLTKGSVSLTCSMVHEYLVVTEIVSWIKHKEFMLVFISKRHYNFAFIYHVKLTKVFSSIYKSLIRYKNAAVERNYEKGNKFISCICTLERKDVFKHCFKFSK